MGGDHEIAFDLGDSDRKRSTTWSARALLRRRPCLIHYNNHMSIGLSLDTHGSYLQVDSLLLHRAIKLDIDQSDEHI